MILFRNTSFKLPLAVLAAGLAGVISTGFLAESAQASTICPAIGADTDCQTLITINADGSATVTSGLNNGPYDGIEDTLLGVVNNYGSAIGSIDVSGNYIFGFDGDGQSYYTGVFYDPTGYGGPGVSFTNIDMSTYNTGTVNFAGGIATGGTAWFTLEADVNAANFKITGIAPVPLPATGLLLLGGLGAMFARKRRKSA